MNPNSPLTDSFAGSPASALVPTFTLGVTGGVGEAHGGLANPPVDLRVLHVVNGEHFSGAERVQSHLGRCLPSFGVAADFASVKPGKFAEKVAQQDGAWGTGYVTPMKHRFDLRPAKSIRHLIDDRQVDLIHAHTPRSALIAAAAARISGVPWVYHVHSPAARDSNRGLGDRFRAWTEKHLLRRCEQVITVSKSLRDDCIASGIGRSKISVVHNGVPAICPQRTHVPQPGGKWVLGVIALHRPRKGLEVALHALAAVRHAGHDAVLRLIGPFETESYRDRIQDEISRLNLQSDVQQIGFTDDVPAELAKLDALLLPSLFGEGLPMVVLEAMAAALPVIATSVEGTPEAIRHGFDGLLAQPGDAVTLATCITDLMTGKYDWNEMSQSAIARHAQHFSDLAMARATADVYREVLKR